MSIGAALRDVGGVLWGFVDAGLGRGGGVGAGSGSRGVGLTPITPWGVAWRSGDCWCQFFGVRRAWVGSPPFQTNTL